jgi:hypothetical protein
VLAKETQVEHKDSKNTQNTTLNKQNKNIIPYFSIDNAHPKLFDIPFDV